MNFLAHLYLSGDDPGIQIGNFIGDFVKGRNLTGRFPEAVVKGIQLHRAIDAYTDSHEVVAQSKNLLRPRYRHYAGVIVDLYYDHFLASRWSEFHTQPLSHYAQHAYTLIRENLSVLPEEVQYMFPYMVRGNWLVSYASVEGIGRALQGMARRTSFRSGMEEATAELREYYSEFETHFLTFIPQLSAHASDFISQH
jgi:acyl carrier protein phosphodiesterase